MIRPPIGRGIVFAGALVAALIILLPLRLATGWLGDIGLGARTAEGSVWHGRLIDAQIAGMPIGDVRAGLSPFGLLLARAHIGLAREGEGDPLQGAVILASGVHAIEGMNAHVPIEGALAPLPVSAIDLADVDVRFRDGLCDHAEGLVRASVSGAIGGIALPGGLSGTARCERGELLLPLASQSGLERLSLRLGAGNAWRGEVTIRPTAPAMGPALIAAGFTAGDEGYVLRIAGHR